MTTKQDLIAQLRALGIPDWAMARVLMTQAADTLEALQAEVANLRRKQRVTEGIAGDYKEQLDAALARLAEIESLRKDAERYRWLRDVPNLYRDHPAVYSAIVEGFTSMEIETSIDAAISKELT